MTHALTEEMTTAYADELAPGTSLCHGQYTIEKYLNSGGFGVTYLTRDSLERKVVIKECFPNAMCCRRGEEVRLRSKSYVTDFERVVELFEKEARALAHLQHPNIVGVHQIFSDNGTAYMALDFVDGLDLLDILSVEPERLTSPEISRLLRSLLEALTYVHENGILHRDISPDNILLDAHGEPVLIDFGAARESATRASRILSRVHTVKDGYSPQEFYVAGSAQSPSSDLYALAATFYHLITGEPPINSNFRLGNVAQNKPDPYQPLLGRVTGYEPRLLASVDQCLSLFPRDRLESASDWLDMLNGASKPSEDGALGEGFERRIAELVEQNRRILAEAAQLAEAEEENLHPEPAPEEEEARAAEREYWAILNEDPADWYAEEEDDALEEFDEETGEDTAASLAEDEDLQAAIAEFLERETDDVPLVACQPDATEAAAETPPEIRAGTTAEPATGPEMSPIPSDFLRTDMQRPKLSLSALLPWAGR